MDKPKEMAAASSVPDPSSVPSEAAPTASNTGVGEEIYFLARKELDFGANHAHTALLLADLDGDGQQELVVGSLDGKLVVYKGLGRKEPWALASGLGMLRVFATGRVWPWLKATKQRQSRASATTSLSGTASTEQEAREGETEESEEPPRESPPQLIAVTVEGDLYVFDFSNAPPFSLPSPSSSSLSGAELEQHASQPNLKDNKILPSPPPAQQPRPWKLVPSQTLSIEPNVTAALIVDMDGDGTPELLLGRMDGAVQVFGWRFPPLPPSPRSADQDEEEEEEHQQNYQPSEPELYEKGAGQVSSCVVSLSAVHCEGPNGRSLCMVAGLDTGTVEVLRCFSSGKGDGDAPLSSLVDLGIGAGLPLPHCGWSGPLTCCSLPGGGQGSGSGGFAVAGLDGRLAMGVVEQQHEEQQQQLAASDEDLVWKTVWSLQTTQPFYAVAPLRITGAGSGPSGFAACAWSGFTCLVNAATTDAGSGGDSEGGSQVDVLFFDPSRMLVPPLRGFIAGRFGERNEPCLFYSCADGHILVFHDLERQLQQMREPSSESEDETAAAARQLRSEEAQKLVKAWIDLHLAGATSEAGSEAEEGTSVKNRGSNVEERPSNGAVPAEGK